MAEKNDDKCYLKQTIKSRYFKNTNSLLNNPNLKEAAYELKNHPTLIIRKADKSKRFIVLVLLKYLAFNNLFTQPHCHRDSPIIYQTRGAPENT